MGHFFRNVLMNFSMGTLLKNKNFLCKFYIRDSVFYFYSSFHQVRVDEKYLRT